VSSALGGTAAEVTRYLVHGADPVTLAVLRWGDRIFVRAADRTDASRLLAAARELGRDYIQAGEILLVEDTHGKGHLSDHIENKIRHSLFFPIEARSVITGSIATKQSGRPSTSPTR
jgi:hypothetical protein